MHSYPCEYKGAYAEDVWTRTKRCGRYNRGWGAFELEGFLGVESTPCRPASAGSWADWCYIGGESAHEILDGKGGSCHSLLQGTLRHTTANFHWLTFNAFSVGQESL